MCGICGLTALDGSSIRESQIKAMSETLGHRGPDDQGLLCSGPIGLGFRRLSIVDLNGGRQPMSNEDGRLWIVYNGEIYNHPSLRPFLEQRGHLYSSNSDTETILHAYEEWGQNCVDHLQGMFAFAIWDTERQRLFCARDRLGIKPFYYALGGNHFAFASEIKALLEVPGCHPRLNRRALPEFFAFGYVSSSETLFAGINKLLPGHTLSIDLAGKSRTPRIRPYWDLNVSPSEMPRSEAEYSHELRQRFLETVRSHLMSDVPVGVFLSGGLDSSSIAAVMAEVQRAPIESFSVGYKEDRYSELGAARLVAQHLGTNHNEVLLGPDDFFRMLPELTWHEDEPIVWPSSVALNAVARLARQKVKVVLTGEGADEIFAGYLKYRATIWNLNFAPTYRKFVPSLLQRWIEQIPERGMLPDWLRRKLRHSFLYCPNTLESIHFDNFYSVFSLEQQRGLFDHNLEDELRDANPYAVAMQYFRSKRFEEELLSKLLYVDIKTYLVELLMKQDQMSMAASVESRVPFLDHKLVEWTLQLPARYKIRGFSGKYLLRKAMASYLPSAIVKGNKRGFPTPIRPWLRHQLFDQLSSVLTDGRLYERRLLRSRHVERLLCAHRAGFSWATEQCWRLLTFELWCRIFLDREGVARDSRSTELTTAVYAA